VSGVRFALCPHERLAQSLRKFSAISCRKTYQPRRSRRSRSDSEIIVGFKLRVLRVLLRKYEAWRASVSLSTTRDCVIPAWSAGIQADMDVSGCILRTWMPAIHAGMTKISIFMFCRRAKAHETLRGQICGSVPYRSSTRFAILDPPSSILGLCFGCSAAAPGLCDKYSWREKFSPIFNKIPLQLRQGRVR
jgi:hypothetical protein